LESVTRAYVFLQNTTSNLLHRRIFIANIYAAHTVLALTANTLLVTESMPNHTSCSPVVTSQPK